MIVLQASHVQKAFDGHDILLDASITVQNRDKIGLVGPNGAGKTTLIRILTSEMSADAGSVAQSKGSTIGYVAQYLQKESGDGEARPLTVYEFVALAFQPLRDMENKLRAFEAQMSDPAVYENEKKLTSVNEAYAELANVFAGAGGYAIDANIRRVLVGLDFPTTLHEQPVQSLSGGQKTRLALARLLAESPSLLLLDEPTNYLDTDTLSWLEGFLQGYDGSVLVVSHDRYFLDAVATQIVELEAGRTTTYTGNYSTYMDTKAANLEADEKRYETEQAEKRRIETFVQKNIVRASTTKRAQSRQKWLERMAFMEKPTASVPKMAIGFEVNTVSGKDVLRIEHLAIGYPAKTLAQNLSLYIERGMRLAILGPNGIGKTTLLRTLTGDVAAIGGSYQFGHHVDIGYYTQEQTDLDAAKTVISQLWDEHPQLDRTTIRTALGRYLFRGEEVEKPIATLSGGERSRLNLCRLMLQGANTLLLDEPTNHLDLLAKEVLEDALDEFPGTILFVSHDRYFIDAIATHVVVVTPGGFEVYIGNYTDYRRKVADRERWAAAEADNNGSAQKGQPQAGSPSDKQEEPVERRRIRSSDVRKAQRRVETLEQEMANMEQRLLEIAEALGDAAMVQDVEATRELARESEDVTDRQSRLMSEWETAVLELEAIEEEAK